MAVYDNRQSIGFRVLGLFFVLTGFRFRISGTCTCWVRSNFRLTVERFGLRTQHGFRCGAVWTVDTQCMDV